MGVSDDGLASVIETNEVVCIEYWGSRREGGRWRGGEVGRWRGGEVGR